MRRGMAMGMRAAWLRMRTVATAAGLTAITLAVCIAATGTAAAPVRAHVDHRVKRTHRPHRKHRARKSALTIYSLVHRCEAVTNAGTGQALTPGSGPVRMQAAALGTYLLYTTDGQFLTDTSADAPTPQPDPSTAAEWLVTGSASRGFTLTNLATHGRTAVKFSSATGCATYPEAQIGATGSSFTGASPEANALGTVEGHAHITAFELFGGDWHCGRPWSPFGVVLRAPGQLRPPRSRAPTECSSRPWTSAARPDQPASTAGRRSSGGPRRPRWLRRATTTRGWSAPGRAGLRVFVTDLVDNEELCKLMTDDASSPATT